MKARCDMTMSCLVLMLGNLVLWSCAGTADSASLYERLNSSRDSSTSARESFVHDRVWMKTALEAYCGELALSLCEREMDCGYDAGHAACADEKSDVAAISLRERCLGAAPLLDDFTFDAAAGRACLTDLSNLGCGQLARYETLDLARCLNLTKSD
jgi:hypothetical protein